MKLGALVEKLLKKAGIDTTTDDLKAIIESDTEVPDEIASKVDKGLLTVEAAKSHPEVNKALRQSILGVADTKMDELITELGLHPGDDFVNEKNTYEKLVKLTKLANEAGKKATGAGNKQTADEFAKKEAEYNKQLKELKDSLTAKETEWKSTRDNDLTSFELQKILLGKDYIFPKEMDSNLKVTTALGAVNNELTKKGFRITRDEAGQLKIVNKEGQPAYNEADNVAYEPNTFIDGALAQNKLLKINDPDQPAQPGSPGAQNVIPGGGAKGNQAIVSEIDAQLAAFK